MVALRSKILPLSKWMISSKWESCINWVAVLDQQLQPWLILHQADLTGMCLCFNVVIYGKSILAVIIGQQSLLIYAQDSLIRISITSSGASGRRRETNKMWMVDLGGSERLLKTQASGRRLEEGKAINLSLSALGDVINALQSKKPHVPYRYI